MSDQANQNELTNLLRTVRLQLTKDQIELLVNYALRNGYQRKESNHHFGVTEQNHAAKWAILSRLGFSE
jgi:hypothetical protein